MSGSEKQLKTSVPKPVQHPLKGFITVQTHEASGRDLWVEGMGAGRVRIKLFKTRPGTK